jgi:hypothetical protein
VDHLVLPTRYTLEVAIRTKTEIYEMLARAAKTARFDIAGEEYFKHQHTVRKRNLGNNRRTGKPDCVWLSRGVVLAAFEVEGWDVEDGWDRGMHKNCATLFSPDLESARVRAVILFGARKNRKEKNRVNAPGASIEERAEWCRWRARRHMELYEVPEEFRPPVFLDLELDAPAPQASHQTLLDWLVDRARDERSPSTEMA